jgi:hypothetical protein
VLTRGMFVLKKVILVLGIMVTMIFAVGLMGCGSGGSKQTNGNSSSEETKKNTTLLSKDEFKQMYSDPDKFKDRKVDFYAKIFQEPEKDEKGTYIQAFADPDNSEENTLIQVSDPKLDVKNNDIIHVIGTVEKKYTGKNGFGAEISAPVITATKVEKSDYGTAFDPAKKTITVNKEINQNGYVIKLNKVEFGAKNTRAYLTITNNSKEQIDFNPYDAKATQGNTQFEVDSSNLDYPELKTEILPGIKEEGVVLFKPLNPDGGNCSFIFTGSSENYELEFNPFTFNINVQ